MDNDDGPPIARPIPRRPFPINLMSAASSYEDGNDAAEPSLGLGHQDSSSSSRYLDSSFTPTDAASLSRPQSIMNLTSSTLMGIFSEATSNIDRSCVERDEPDTPWGTGARTPIMRASIDDTTYRLMRDRSHQHRQRSSVDTIRAPSNATVALSRAFRALLLFLLGVGYGVLVTRLHKQQQYLVDLTESIMKPVANWKYLTFWGVAGVVLGSLLPWVDRRWETTFGSDAGDDDDEATRTAQRPGTDWALVMRAIGAFVGIMFAIRKLAWASTLQVSATLALVNPLLWWLIDRSKSGFVLSACVGLTGSILLLGVNPDMMPTPSRSTSPSATAAQNFSSTAAAATSQVPTLVLGGLASQETVETGVWMLSVLFCSCVCFGNIGRRLAWSRKAGARGRWGGVR